VLLVWRLAAQGEPPGGRVKSVAVAIVCRRRLAAALCPPGGDGAAWLLFGRWRLAARVW